MTSARLSLEQRIGRLESQNRILLVALAGLFVFAILGAAGHPDPSHTDSFQLTDEHGKVRAELAIHDGTVGLYLKDEKGNDRFKAFHDSDATGIFINDEHGTTRVGIAQFAHGGGGVALHGPESKGAAVLYLKGDGSLRFFDADGKVTNQVSARAPDTE